MNHKPFDSYSEIEDAVLYVYTRDHYSDIATAQRYDAVYGISLDQGYSAIMDTVEAIDRVAEMLVDNVNIGCDLLINEGAYLFSDVSLDDVVYCFESLFTTYDQHLSYTKSDEKICKA
jgi:hypothetical protein